MLLKITGGWIKNKRIKYVNFRSHYSAGSKKLAKYVSEEYLTRKSLDGQAPTEYN